MYLARDLEDIVEDAAADLHAFANTHLLITGGTGFIGSWLLWSLYHANRRLGINIKADVLTRDPDTFAKKEPVLAGSPQIRLVRGDITSTAEFDRTYDGIVHAATPASATLIAQAPNVMLQTILRGGQNIAALAERSGAIPVLFTSSGAVYGTQPSSIALLTEDFSGAPDCTDPQAAYQEGKRCGELQCAITALHSGGRAAIARLFAFVGPYLPIDRHFAVGNFIGDGLSGNPIHIRGDGSTVRSYLYASDMITWLWAVFARGTSRRAYNIGSDVPITIASLATAVASAFEPQPQIIIAKTPVPGREADRYVPSTARICSELGVRRRVELPEAISRTIIWHRSRSV
jgi:nucleoside-diphosphate-sugar epimerase